MTALQGSATAPRCESRTLCAVRDGVLGVPEPNSSWRLVILGGNLQSDIVSFFHGEAGHPGGQRTLMAVCRYVYWPNVSRSATSNVAACCACQAATAYQQASCRCFRASRHPGGTCHSLDRSFLGIVQVGKWVFVSTRLSKW